MESNTNTKQETNKKRRKNGQGSWSEVVISGTHYYLLKKSYGGKRKSFYGKTKKEARDKAVAFEETNRLNSSKEIQLMSLHHYAKKWLDEWKPKKIKETTYDYYNTIIEVHLKDSKLGIMQLKMLNKSESQTEKYVKDFLTDFAKDHSKSYTDGTHTLLKQVSKYAYQKKDMNFDFMLNIPRIDEEDAGHKKKERKSLSEKEVSKLIVEVNRKNVKGHMINGKEGTYVYGIGAYALLFCCFTGLRWGEMSGLRWKDMNLKDKTFRPSTQFVRVKNRDKSEDDDKSPSYIMKKSKLKTDGSERTLPLCKQAIQILDMVKSRFPECHKKEHLVFSRSDAPLKNANGNKLLKSLCKRAEITDVTPHELRHSFASLLLWEDEKNLYVVSELLGHSSPDFTYRQYIHIFEEKKAQALTLFDNMFTDINENANLNDTDNKEKK